MKNESKSKEPTESRRSLGRYWVLDGKEHRDTQKVQARIEKEIKPGKAGTLLKKAVEILPAPVREFPQQAFETASELGYIKKALSGSIKGTRVLLNQAAKVTVSKDAIVRRYSTFGIQQFEEVPLVRSYEIRKLRGKGVIDRGMALIEGAATGAPGLYGVPTIGARYHNLTTPTVRQSSLANCEVVIPGTDFRTSGQ